MTDFTELVDLASRDLGGSVVMANDELFAEKENLIKPGPAEQVGGFGHKGGLYDGWETRRRREPGHDFAVIRLGAPGIIRGIVVDTAHFKGNYPDTVSVEAASFEGYPTPAELTGHTEWVEVVGQTTCLGDTRNTFAVQSDRRFTHVRLNIFPDGGVARLRAHGEVVPDPRFLLDVPLDLASVEHGGRVTACSNGFYASPDRVLGLGRPLYMDGWETSRRRDSGHDWLEVSLAAAGLVSQVEIDTSYNVGNAPGACSLQGYDDVGMGDEAESAEDLMPHTPLQPDTRHRFRIDAPRPVTRVRLNIYPDGGVARLRVFGRLTEEGYRHLALRWFNSLPDSHARAVLASLQVSADAAGDLVAERPFVNSELLDRALARLPQATAGEDGSARRLLTGR